MIKYRVASGQLNKTFSAITLELAVLKEADWNLTLLEIRLKNKFST